MIAQKRDATRDCDQSSLVTRTPASTVHYALILVPVHEVAITAGNEKYGIAYTHGGCDWHVHK